MLTYIEKGDPGLFGTRTIYEFLGQKWRTRLVHIVKSRLWPNTIMIRYITPFAFSKLNIMGMD